MRLAFGPIQVTLKNTYQRHSGGPIVYQRAVPTDLRDRYPGKTIKHDLKTADVAVAARQVRALNTRYEAEWAGLRAAPSSAPAALKAHAEALMRHHGLTAGDTSSDEADVFLDGLRDKLERHAGDDTEAYDSATPSDYLSPVEAAVLTSLRGTSEPSLSDALDLHLSIHPQRDDARFVTYQRRAFDTLLAVTGDKAMADFKRADARAYLDAALLTAKTTTVRRRLGVMSAVFATYLRENNLPTTTNPFSSLTIAREGHDSTKRFPFTPAELATLDAACRSKDDPMRWLLALLAGTGARLAEIVGLPLADIVLDHDHPHVILQVHPWRDIKGAKGIRGVKDRTVPLVGSALWAAKRIKDQAKDGQLFAFPQYTDSSDCKATSASSALNGWLRRLPLPHTCHDLRHTLKDQLRAVQAPKDLSDAITGHGTKSVSDSYGLGYGLEVKAEWLTKALVANNLQKNIPA